MIGKWGLLLHTRLLALYHLPLAAMISLDTLRDVLNTLGYPAVALFIMIESAGIPFPGETMLLLASFYAAVDHRLQIPMVIACAALGAIVGDNIGYCIGRTGGYALVQRYGRFVFLKQEHQQKAESFFAKHGDKTVFLGRFIAVLRAWAAFLAGTNRMRWSTFLFYNAAGGIIWAIIYGCLGFYAGRIFHDNFGAVEHLAKMLSWTGGGLIIAAVVVIYLLFRWRRKRRILQSLVKAQETISEVPSPPAIILHSTSISQQKEQKMQPDMKTDEQTEALLALSPQPTAQQVPETTSETLQEMPPSTETEEAGQQNRRG
jgi:membrane protein DedA with SNARE-associated domain